MAHADNAVSYADEAGQQTLRGGSQVASGGTDRSTTAALLIAILAACAAMFFISFPQMADPLIRFDDYPAYFGEEDLYLEKTIAEGRWLNYWWMAGGNVWPSPFSFAIYQIAWAIFAAAAAVNALGPRARLLDTGLLSVLIAFSPQAFLISGWFNTLMPGTLLVAAYAVAVLYLAPSAGRWLFLLAAPVSMLSYSTYPLLMMGLLLTRHDLRRSFRDLAFLMVLLAVSIALGMLLMYSINWHYHGVFGLQIADWRGPSPARDLAGLLENLKLMPVFFERLFLSIGFGQIPLSILNTVLLAGSLGVLATRRPAEAAYIAAGIVASVGLMLIHSLEEGVEIPMRALIVLWVLYPVALIRAVQVYAPPERTKGLTALVMVIAALYGGQLLKHTRLLMDWQHQTRALAARIPPGATELVFYGKLWALPGAENAGILHHSGLSFRMRQLTGLPAVNCGNPVIICNYTPPFDPNDQKDGEVLMRQVGGTVFFRLPKPPPGMHNPLGPLG